MKTRDLFCLISLFLLLSLPANAQTPPRYTLTVLPLTFSGYNEIDNNDCRGGINTPGQIVGAVSVKSGGIQHDRIALWQKDHPLRILDKTPVTQADDESGRDFLYATAINKRGVTIGTRTVSSSGAYTIRISSAAILWNGRVSWFKEKFPSDPDTSSAALGLNDQGDVVGGFVYDNTTADQIDSSPPPGTGSRHAFLRHNGRILSLWPGVARGINDHGWIVGIKDVDYNDSHARGVLWRNGHITHFPLQPVAINEQGEIAGNIPLNDDLGKACLWRQGRIIRLSKQISHASALNNRGEIVGEMGSNAFNHTTRATLWRHDHTYDLNHTLKLPKNWVLETALGINDKGWIIGEGSVYKSPKDKQPLRSFTFLLRPERSHAR